MPPTARRLESFTESVHRIGKIETPAKGSRISAPPRHWSKLPFRRFTMDTINTQ